MVEYGRADGGALGPGAPENVLATHGQVPLWVLAANQCPDHDTICTFRRCHLAELFVQVLELCQRAGLVKLGYGALAGTKLQANASKHRPARSRSKRTLRGMIRRKLRTAKGRAAYAKRKQTVEPVFGQIKQARAFRRFLLRGLEAVRPEWRLI